MINKAIILGNIGMEPEIRSMPNGNRVCSFSVATSDFWKDKEGNRQSKTEWHRVVVFNENLISIVEKFVKKGSRVYIEAPIRTRKYTDQSGNSRSVTEIVIQGFSDVLKIIDFKNDDNPSQGSQFSKEQAPNNNTINSTNEDSGSYSDDQVDDEIPF